MEVKSNYYLPASQGILPSDSWVIPQYDLQSIFVKTLPVKDLKKTEQRIPVFGSEEHGLDVEFIVPQDFFGHAIQIFRLEFYQRLKSMDRVHLCSTSF